MQGEDHSDRWVFLSHNSKDKNIVKELARILDERGIRAWLDERHLTPGRSWREELEEVLAESVAVVVCVGPHGLGPTQRGEISIALDTSTGGSERLVIPAFLPGAPPQPEIPAFLSQRTSIDLRGGLDSDNELRRLKYALRGIQPSAEAKPRGVEPASGQPRDAAEREECPYQGLEHFDENDSDRYFGRHAEINEILKRLCDGERLITLLGVSGVGKSSLLLAGLLPEIRRGRIDNRKDPTIVKIRSSARPLHDLALQLLKRQGKSSLEELRALETALLSREATLSDAADLLETPLVVAVDQFEALLIHCTDEKERFSFVANMVHASSVPDGSVKVFLTLRADFIDRIFSLPRKSADAIMRSQAFVHPLREEQLREVIESPADRADYVFEDGLVDILIREVEGQPGDLPLLQFMLKLLWQEREGKVLTWGAYRSLGELRGAITHWADEFFDQLGSDKERNDVRRIFGRLVHRAGGVTTRKRGNLENLLKLIPERSRHLLDELIDLRLLTVHEDAVEIAHDALIHNWDRFRRWIKHDEEFILWRQRLHVARDAWTNTGHDPGALLRGAPLVEAERWLEERREDLGNERRFIVESIRGHERRSRKAEERRRRELSHLKALAEEQRQLAELESKRANEQRRSRQRFVILASALSLALILLSVLAWFWKQEQNRFRIAWLLKTAEEASDPTVASLILMEGSKLGRYSDPLDSFRVTHFVARKPLSNLRLSHTSAVSSIAVSPSGDYLVAGTDSGKLRVWTRDAISKGHELGSHDSSIQSIAFSPDGKRFASGATGGTIKIWPMTAAGEASTLAGHEGRVRSLAFSSDSERLASGSDDHAVRIWSVETSASPIQVLGGSGRVYSVVYDPKNRYLVGGYDDGSMRVWQAYTGSEMATWRTQGGGVWSVAFSPDGEILAAASEDGVVRLWRVSEVSESGPHEPEVLNAGSWLRKVAFSPDGEEIAAGDERGRIWVWNSEQGGESSMYPHEASLLLEGHGQGIWDIAFDPGGRYLASASQDGTVRIWQRSYRREPILLTGHAEDVTSVDFGPHGKILASGSEDGTVRIWPANGSGESRVLEGHKDKVTKVAFSSDGQHLASSSEDKTVRVWRIDSDHAVEVLDGHEEKVWSVAFSADGGHLASASDDGTLRLHWLGKEGPPVVLGAEGGVLSTAFSPDGRYVAGGQSNGAIRVWRSQDLKADPKILESHSGGVWSVAFDAKGERMVTGSADSTVRIWWMDDRKEPLILKSRGGIAWSAVFSPDGEVVASSFEDGSIRLWRSDGIGRPLVIDTADVEVWSIDFSPDGKRLASGSKDGALRIWRFSWDSLIDHLRAMTAVCLSAEERAQYFLEQPRTAEKRHAECERSRGPSLW